MKKSKLNIVEDVYKNIPIKNPLEDLVKNDRARIDKISASFLKHTSKAIEKSSYIEVFLLNFTYIEQILLPALIRDVCYKLKLKKIPKIDERTQISNLISHYYFLSHDQGLYEDLVKLNATRRKIVHNLSDDGDMEKLVLSARKAAAHCYEFVTIPIFKRLDGQIIVPSLLIYSNGWNDSRNQTIDYLKKAVESLKQKE